MKPVNIYRRALSKHRSSVIDHLPPGFWIPEISTKNAKDERLEVKYKDKDGRIFGCIATLQDLDAGVYKAVEDACQTVASAYSLDVDYKLRGIASDPVEEKTVKAVDRDMLENWGSW